MWVEFECECGGFECECGVCGSVGLSVSVSVVGSSVSVSVSSRLEYEVRSESEVCEYKDRVWVDPFESAV